MGARLLLAGMMVLVLGSCAGEGSGGTTVPPDVDSTLSGSEPGTTAGGATTTSGESDAGADDPCSLASSEMVVSAFGATGAAGEPGIARNCHFTIEGGVSASVEVFHYGSSDQWDGVREGYEDNRGGVTEVDGLGEAAYQPNDAGPYEIVVLSGDTIFAVAVQEGSGGPEVEAAIVELAGAIAGS